MIGDRWGVTKDEVARQRSDSGADRGNRHRRRERVREGRHGPDSRPASLHRRNQVRRATHSEVRTRESLNPG